MYNIYYIIISENKKEVIRMKVEKIIKKRSDESIRKEEFMGKDWKNKRFYLFKPKDAYINYETQTYHKNKYDRGRKLNEWHDELIGQDFCEVMYKLVKD